MTRRLLLHIGHAKTGSSYAQSMFALSVEALRAAGVAYPQTGKMRRARAGMPTNGNAETWADAVFASGNANERALDFDGTDTLLLSAESLTPRLARDNAAAHLANAANANDVDQIRVLLITRDPLEHMISTYAQQIKAGHVVTLNKIAKAYNQPVIVGRALRNLATLPNVEVDVVNYRRYLPNPAAIFATWLGIPADTLTLPPHTRVNRSLTVDEIAFQLRMNERFGRRTGIIAEPLMRELPDMLDPAPTLSLQGLRAFNARLRQMVKDVNDLLPRSDRYHLGGPLAWIAPSRLWAHLTRRKDVRLTHEQVRLIVDGFANHLEPHIRRKK